MAEVGLIVSASDRASAILETVGSTGKKSLEGIRGAADKAKSAFKAFGVGVALFNQGLELAKKAVQTFKVLISDTVAKALEFRRAGDPVVEEFDEMRRSADVLRARIGDVLIPILLGLKDTFTDTGNSVVEFINTNRKLIATKITEYLAETARVLIKGVAFGATLVAEAFFGVRMVINLVKAAFEVQIETILSGIASIIEGLSWLERMLPGTSDGFAGIAANVRALGEEFSSSRKESVAAIKEQAAALEATKKAILSYKEIAVDVVGEAEVKILERIKHSRTGLTRIIEDQGAAAVETGDKTVAALEKTNEALESMIATSQSLMSSAMVEIFDMEKTATDKLKSFSETALKIGVDTIQKLLFARLTALTTESAAQKTTTVASVTMHAAEAGSKTTAAYAWLPPLALALGAAMFTAVLGLFLTKFQFGGIVRGGVPNRDSVPALLTPGERVLTQRERRDFEGRETDRGAVQSTTVSINAQIQNPEEMTDAQVKRWLIRLDKQAGELVRDGIIFNDLARA
jgi:hypothetical protein